MSCHSKQPPLGWPDLSKSKKTYLEGWHSKSADVTWCGLFFHPQPPNGSAQGTRRAGLAWQPSTVFHYESLVLVFSSFPGESRSGKSADACPALSQPMTNLPH